MGKASSAKKVARAARAGGSTKQRKRNLAFPLGIVAIIIVGALVIFVARGSNETASAAPPTTNDHWHAAFGIYVCDTFLPAVADGATDTKGIHTHQDGIIHIHPFSGGSAGSNAKMKVFADQVGMSFSSTGFTMPDGTEYKNGYDCNGTPAVVTVSQWNSADELIADPNTPPDVVYTKDFGSIHFENDRMAFTLAVAPEGTTIPGPQSLDTLNNLTDVTTTTSLDINGLTGSSTTLAPGASTTTAAGEPSTTAAPGATNPTSSSTSSSTATTVP